MSAFFTSPSYEGIVVFKVFFSFLATIKAVHKNTHQDIKKFACTRSTQGENIIARVKTIEKEK